jgi:hypothetical protein
MRTPRLSLAVVTMLGLIGAMGGAVMAQADHSTVGVWVAQQEEQGCWSRPISVTEYDEQPNGDFQVRRILVGCDFAFSDPRVSGAWTWELNEDCFADGGCVNWGPMHVAGQDGSWSGWYTGTEDPDSQTRFHVVLAGKGAYDGLTHIQEWSGPFYGPYDRYGVIYDGQPPAGEADTDHIRAVVASQDARAGYVVLPELRLVPATGSGPAVFTDLHQAKGRTAAVDIPAGTPLTPDVLEPAE